MNTLRNWSVDSVSVVWCFVLST